MSKPDRLTILRRVAAMAGRGIVEVREAANGWPALVNVHVGDGPVPVALHVSAVEHTHRGRDAVERRFQNPGKWRPLQAPVGFLPLLVGLWEEIPRQPILAAMDARRRIGRGTRQSLFVRLQLLRDAAENGWSSQMSASGEQIFAFIPPLLPVYVAMARDETFDRVATAQVAGLVGASGALASGQETGAERARRASMALVRGAAFSGAVLRAYDGCCALCGLDFDLVEGAHIFPVHAVGSRDEVWNGLALCGNHHAAFDRHLIWIDPASREVRFHPSVREEARRNASCRAFVTGTFERLAEPHLAALRPTEDMFLQRYELYAESYAWASKAAARSSSTPRRPRLRPRP